MRATGMVHFGFAVLALNKQQMTLGIGTVCDVVALLSTVIALRQYMVCNRLSSSTIKGKVFALE